MNLLSHLKTTLLGKTLLLNLLLIMLVPAMGQTSQCKSDFEIKIDQNSKTIKLHARSNRQPAVFGWTISDGSAYRGQTVSHTFRQAGTYKVCLKTIAFDSATNQRCTTDVCKAVTIVDCSRLEAKFELRQDEKTIKVIGTSNSKNAVYAFSFGDGTVKRGKELKHTYDKGGIYEVCLIVKDTVHGCITRVCKKITIRKDCDLEAKYLYRQDGNDFKFLAKANQRPARFVWDFGDGNKAYGDEVKHSYKKPGVYKVCLTVYTQSTTNKDRICKVEVCKRVVVKKKERECELRANFEFKTHKNKLFVEAKANEHNLHYFWTFGDGTDATGKVQRHKYKKPGVYEVCLIVFNPKTKCKVCVCKKVIIVKPCKLKGEIKFRQSSNKFLFKARSNASALANYHWDFGDGSTGTGKAIRHTYSKKGVYKVKLVIKDRRADCKIVRYTLVYVGVKPPKRVAAQLDNSSEAVKDDSQELEIDWQANVSPVPAVNKIDVSSGDKTLTKVKIYGADGALALETDRDLHNIDISILSKGFYYAHVYASDGTFKIVKFIKES